MIANTVQRDRFSGIAYEICISILALVAVVTSIWDFSEKANIELINNLVLSIFVIDYATRFIMAANKREFVKNNILDLIAIIPFSAAFRAFRMTRLLRVAKLTRAIKIFRICTFSKRFHENIKNFLNTNGFIYMIYITISTIMLGAGLLYMIEKGEVIKTFEDALWMSFTTTTLFGYEGVEGLTIGGKVIAATLILLGISFAGVFTATMATFFINRRKKYEEFENRILDLSDFTETEFEQAISYIEYIRDRR